MSKNSPKTITITRTFAASREQVYAAWTQPEHFSKWYGGKEATVPLETLSMDVRPGGAWRAVMHLPNDFTMEWSGEYVTVDPPSFLSFTMTDDPSAPAGEPVEVTFTEVEGGTEMTLTQYGADDFTEEQYDMTILGYNAYFDALAASLTA